ncbi:MAG: NAD-dependent epimerase/dehydratase family protein [Candidatus Omnitrophota bacterium]|nr:MAG: NAD-dependent epimerase/dehydratase family protein [Candidatus Omnitrophota bacterium]
MERVLVTGAGGFIGHHLVKFLKKHGYWVRGVDRKHPEFEKTSDDDFKISDLRESKNCMKACKRIDYVYQLAADMGGIGYITEYHAPVTRNNALINLHMLEAAHTNNVKKYLFTSSACIYPQYLQNKADAKALKEEDAYPADAEPGYGWEKLFAELASQYYRQDYGLKTYIVRFHNIFGPQGTYEGGREKSPAAICRKIALAKDGDAITIWGDGKQTRSYCYIDDCVEGIYRLIQSDYHNPMNLGQGRLVTIDELVEIVAKIAGKTITKNHDISKPLGVMGRNADISLAKKVLGWEPKVLLEKGLEITYRWIEAQLLKTGRL